jgi:class 3 adenylate cyclase
VGNIGTRQEREAMAETRRKLTTIFSADVYGYSSMMEADEEGTLARLKRLREAMARLIEAHSGRVVNPWGDGLLAEFSSVVEAVRAAVDVQGELASIDDAGGGRPMLFRIGINLGDVIVDGDNIYGDGVNIAARLQESAAPGGILISRNVYDQVRNKVSVGFDFLGDLAVKNLQEAVPSYAVRIDGQEGLPDRPLNPVPAPLPAAEGEARNRPQFISTRFGTVPRQVATLAFAALVVLVVNLLNWSGTFWAAWPLLAFATLAAASMTRSLAPAIRGPATLGVVGLGLVGVNLLTWHGTFWAVWPLLGFAVLAGFRWVVQPRAPER